MLRAMTLAVVLAGFVLPMVAMAAVTTLPVTVTLTGSLEQTLDTQSTQTGTKLSIFLMPPFANPALKGATVYGHVADVVKAGPGTEPSIALAFDRIVFADNRSKPIHAQLLKDQTVADKSGKEKNAVVNAAGSLVGPAHGIGAHLISRTRKDNVHIPQNSTIAIELTEPLVL